MDKKVQQLKNWPAIREIKNIYLKCLLCFASDADLLSRLRQGFPEYFVDEPGTAGPIPMSTVVEAHLRWSASTQDMLVDVGLVYMDALLRVESISDLPITEEQHKALQKLVSPFAQGTDDEISNAMKKISPHDWPQFTLKGEDYLVVALDVLYPEVVSPCWTLVPVTAIDMDA